MTNKKINKFICLILTILVFCSQMFACGDGVGARYRSFEMENGGYKTTVVFDTKNPIIKDGKTDYVIIVGNNATDTEKYAAEELSSYLEQITGVKVPVYSEKFVKNAETTMKLISVGHTDLKNKTLNYDTVDFNNDGFVIKTVDSTLFLFGGESMRGTLYAVYDYLENCQGCRFYLPEVEKVPKVKNVYLPVMDLVDIPTFALREVVYNTMLDGSFTVKSRLTGEQDIRDTDKEKFGEIHSDFFWGQAHNIESVIIPRSIYGESHSEWYYYDSNVSLYNFDYTYGVKDDGTYDDTMDINPVDIAVESLKVGLLESDAYYLNCSQQDTADTCTNPIYLARKEKIQASGTILQFLNLVCERLDEWIETAVDENGDKLFPNGRPYQILNFAYGHTQTPPVDGQGNVAVKAHKNILTWLAPIEFNALYTYYDTENQISYVPGLFTGWTKCVDSFGLWDYYSNFAVNPCMYYSYYISTAQGNYRYYADLGCVNYVFSEHNGASDWHRNEFDELKTYCSSKLMWNPYRYNMMSLVEEYCNYVFGDQGEEVLKVITAMEDNFALLTSSEAGYNINHSKRDWANYIPLSLIEDNLEILDNAIAENAKSNEVASVKERVDLRLKKFKITIASHLLFEYDSYYPIVDINKKKAFHDEFYGLIEETNFNEYFGKWTNKFYDVLLSYRVT